MLNIEDINKLKKFPELQWSILQHYEVCDTPLLDLKQSLRVAASFALNWTSSEGYIFVFALPYPNGTISYFSEEELVIVRLLSVCPSEALRPHFQEGYLVGTFPTYIKKKQPFLDGELPHDPTSIKDLEICKFVVALTRTRKKCTLIHTRNFAGKWKKPSSFLSWIDPARLEFIKVDAQYWKQQVKEASEN
jgi:hypothetical protein